MSIPQWVLDQYQLRIDAAANSWNTLTPEAQALTTFADYLRDYIAQFPPITYTSSKSISEGELLWFICEHWGAWR